MTLFSQLFIEVYLTYIRGTDDEVAVFVCLLLWRWGSSHLSPSPEGGEN